MIESLRGVKLPLLILSMINSIVYVFIYHAVQVFADLKLSHITYHRHRKFTDKKKRISECYQDYCDLKAAVVMSMSNSSIKDLEVTMTDQLRKGRSYRN